MCLAVIMVRVLTNDDDLDVVKGCVTRPGRVLDKDITLRVQKWHERQPKEPYHE